MAEIKIQIQDELYAKLVEACAARYNYTGDISGIRSRTRAKAIAEGKPTNRMEGTQVTKEEFLVEMIKQEFLHDVLKQGSIMVAQRNASKQVQDELKDISL